MITVYRNSVQSWEIDQMGHMNVQFYFEKALQGCIVLWNKLGINFSDKYVVKSNSRLHDSVLMEAVKIIKEKYLLVDKPSRKTTILEIGFDHKDELLAKSFNENLVSIVNDFYNKIAFLGNLGSL